MSRAVEKVSRIVDLFMELNVVELLELQRALEARGIKPAVSDTLMTRDVRREAEKEEKKSFNVVLKSAGENRIQVIRAVRAITGLDLRKAKELVVNAPVPVKEGLGREDAEKLKKQLEEAGAEVELK